MVDAPLDPAALGKTVLVVAPHPDDESIGCGGLIALARRSGAEVRVVIVTDGTGSHPNSRLYPPARLAALRRQEALVALRVLGVVPSCVIFGGLEDRSVPVAGEPGFEQAVLQAAAWLAALAPSTIVIPAASDLHGDHRAVASIWRDATRDRKVPMRILDYLVWEGDQPLEDPSKARQITLDISAVLALKSKAIACHRTQHGLVIADDPGGFRLPSSLLCKAARPVELYSEVLM